MRSRRHQDESEQAVPARAGVQEQNSYADLMELQRLAGNQAVNAAMHSADDGHDHAAEVDAPGAAVLDVVGSGGRPLDGAVRADMESRLGADFGDVRIHTGGTAADSAAAVDATAYTVGSDIVFGQGAYDPSSTAGRTTLAHELTHVVQQRSGPVDGTPTGDGISVSDPSDAFEQEAAATAAQVVQD